MSYSPKVGDTLKGKVSGCTYSVVTSRGCGRWNLKVIGSCVDNIGRTYTFSNFAGMELLSRVTPESKFVEFVDEGEEL